jgi:hypothetical protein
VDADDVVLEGLGKYPLLVFVDDGLFNGPFPEDGG